MLPAIIKTIPSLFTPNFISDKRKKKAVDKASGLVFLISLCLRIAVKLNVRPVIWQDRKWDCVALDLYPSALLPPGYELSNSSGIYFCHKVLHGHWTQQRRQFSCELSPQDKSRQVFPLLRWLNPGIYYNQIIRKNVGNSIVYEWSVSECITSLTCLLYSVSWSAALASVWFSKFVYFFLVVIVSHKEGMEKRNLSKLLYKFLWPFITLCI